MSSELSDPLYNRKRLEATHDYLCAKGPAHLALQVKPFIDAIDADISRGHLPTFAGAFGFVSDTAYLSLVESIKSEHSMFIPDAL